jgi:DNA-binding beta-propeller fold protein YncE
VPVDDCHEMVRLKNGNIVLCTTHTKNNLIQFDPAGKVVSTFGTTYPGSHGLSLSDENGEEFLWLTDTKRRIVVKLDLKGNEVMTLGWPKETGKYSEEKQFCPTETAINPVNGDIYVADGYGSNWLTHYSAKGEVKGCYKHDGFNCIHGVAYDARDAANPKLLVTSRAANKLFTLSLTGENLGHIDLPGAWICRPVIRGENVFFAVINSGRKNWGSDFRGFVMVLDKANQPVSLIGGPAPQGRRRRRGSPLPQHRSQALPQLPRRLPGRSRQPLRRPLGLQQDLPVQAGAGRGVSSYCGTVLAT